MKKMVALAFLAACASSVFAQAANDWYGELTYGTVTAKDTSASDIGTIRPSQLRLTLGSVVTDNVALEGFITQGLSSDSIMKGSTNIDLKLKTGYGIAVRPFVHVTNDIELFGRAGTVRNENEVIASQGNQSQTFSNKSTNTLYGLGVAYKFDRNMSAVMDYTKLSNKNDMDASIVAIGLRYKF